MLLDCHDQPARIIAGFCFFTYANLLATSFSIAAPVSVTNFSFEVDANNFNEFYFGVPTGWQLFDPAGINGGNDVAGTLTATGSQFFNHGAPDGDNVGILFIGNQVGQGEYGFTQTLGSVLEVDTTYTLTVSVGNIQSGTAITNDFFDLSGFPGYRIELVAGNTVVASDSEGIDSPIPEGEFEDRQIVFTPDASQAGLFGQALQIRLINTNLTDPNFSGVDLEVDFDNVLFDAAPAAVPIPPALPLMVIGLAGLVFGGRRRD